jgi:hypothetical protein
MDNSLNSAQSQKNGNLTQSSMPSQIASGSETFRHIQPAILLMYLAIVGYCLLDD